MTKQQLQAALKIGEIVMGYRMPLICHHMPECMNFHAD